MANDLPTCAIADGLTRLSEDFDPRAYAAFCEVDLVAFARDAASRARFGQVDTLLRHHPAQLAPRRLDILSAISLSTHPAHYAQLLPSLARALLDDGGEGDADPTPPELGEVCMAYANKGTTLARERVMDLGKAETWLFSFSNDFSSHPTLFAHATCRAPPRGVVWFLRAPCFRLHHLLSPPLASLPRLI